MRVHRKLSVICREERAEEFTAAVRAVLPHSWGFSSVADFLTGMPSSQAKFYLICPVIVLPYPAYVYFDRIDPNQVGITNLNFEGPRPESIDIYNLILWIVHEQVIKPACDRARFQVELTSDQAGPSDWLPPELALTLHAFSSGANKGLGGATLLDRRRWSEFIIRSHSDHVRLDPVLLRRWLIEDEGWDEERADLLAAEYDFGLGLLEQAEGRIGAA